MKFGKVLQQSQTMSSPSWEPFWVDYKLLKRIIKDCAQIKKEEKLEGSRLIKTKIKPSAKEDNDSIRTSPDEMNFFRTLRSEIKKIADNFIKEQAAYIGRVKTIEEQFLLLKSDPQPRAKTALMKSCVSLYKELLLLENYAVMNFCGISKILKKHDKWTGYATRNKFMRTILMKQPFATYLPLLQMIDRLEHIFMEATGCSIDQHDAHKRGGGPRRSSNGAIHAASTTGPGSPTTDGDTTSPGSSNVATGNGSPQVTGLSTSSAHQPGGQSPPPDDPVSLVRVHALRDDARQFRQTEGVDDCYDADEDGEGDSIGDSDEAALLRGHSSPQSDSGPSGRPQPSRAMRKDYNSDSDAAAIAMLSMKEGGVPVNDCDAPARYKRKACSPLISSLGSNGKRKMSFATILN